MAKIEVQLDLIRKYNVPGPRYTSYPTAPHFDENISWDILIPYIKANNAPSQSDVPVSLYFHLPFCKSLCWFCGCTNVISLDSSCSTRYFQYLRKELDMIAPLLNPARKIVQLHFGGGSPTFSQPEDILQLGSWIHKLFSFENLMKPASRWTLVRRLKPISKLLRKLESTASVSVFRIWTRMCKRPSTAFSLMS